MRHKKILMILALLCAIVQGALADDYGYPTKTKPSFETSYKGKSNVVVIKTAAELAYVTEHFSEGSGYNDNKDWDALNYYLDADLDMGTEYSWLPLGRESYSVTKYKGTFWGNGHTIKYKTWDLDEENQGLFSTIHKDGKVYDVNVVCDIYTKRKFVGGIAGQNNGPIQNCTVKAKIVIESHQYAGGIVGENLDCGTVTGCRVSGTIKGTIIGSDYISDIGGIAGLNNHDTDGSGHNYLGTIVNCWVSADVSSDGASSYDRAELGGICGTNFAVIKNCCVTGDVTSTKVKLYVGGIVGNNDYSVENCTFYGTLPNYNSYYSKYVGNKQEEQEGSVPNMYDTFNQDEYDAAIAAGHTLYAQAIKYPYAINIEAVGLGAVEVSAGDETGITRWHPGSTVTLTRQSSIPVRSVTVTDADGNNVSVSGNDASGFTFTMPNKDVTATVYYDYANWPAQGNGSEGSPYLISSAEDWHFFAHNVLLGRSYSGKVIKLDNDISVSHLVGDYVSDESYKPFSGTFDGDGNTLTINLSNQSRFAAPFKCVSGATIKNLHTAGSISGTGNADGKLLAGLVGVSFGTTTITGCRSSVTITTDFGTDAAMAGFVAGTKGGSLTISGCVFDGSMTGSSNTRCAGIAGYEYTATTTTISNSLFAPVTLTVSTTDDTYTKTFSRDADATITNCYYTQTLGAVQGTEASTPTSDPGNIGNLVEDYGLVKAYENAIFFDGKYCVVPSATTVIQPEGEWDAVCWQTHTAQTDWTALSAGASTGKTLGSAGNTTYYYITQDLNFSNSTAGGSGLTILGTVYLYIPAGLTLTSTGANASGQTGAGAGIELASGNNLYLIGSGTLNATGGNAANGGNGGTGGNATGSNGDWTETGTGGNGGYGGGGAGAGIGTRGGYGGSGGEGGSGYTYTDWTTHNGTNGTAGSAGATAGAMGTLNVYKVYQQTAAVTVNATGGAAGTTGGNGGQRGRGYAWDGTGNNYTVAGGGGGGAGGFGDAASNIGTGGPGGGGGGGGAGGAQDWRPNSSGGVYDVTAYGGKGGKNADGSSAADGTEAATNGIAQSQGWVTVDNGSFDSGDWNPASGDATFGNGGSGGACGNASNVGTAQRVWGSLVMGSGTENDPYQIKSAADFDQLAANVNSGTTYENTYFELVNDISVSSMVGADDAKTFQGTFDGDGNTLRVSYNTSEAWTAPFRHVKDATIKNLHIDGTIYTSAQKAAGIVGESHRNLNITNCRSSVAINSSVSGDGTHGGLVSTLSGSGNTIIIDGCVFDGSFATTANTNNCGGFVGWPVYNRPTISNSLMKPSSVAAGMLNKTFCRVHNEPTITNCYYVATDNLPTNQGLGYSFASAPANIGTAGEAYTTSGITPYTSGLLYDGRYYMTPEAISLANTGTNDVVSIDGYVANVTLADRTLYKDGKWNTICLPFNVTLAGSPLAGATARPLTSASISGTTLNLTFGDAVDVLLAGTPYIIKWTADANNIENPVFNGVTIDATNRSYDNQASGDIRVRFLGTYKSTEFNTTDNTVLLLGAEDKLYYPLSGASIGAQRAYFKLGDGAALVRQLTAFNIDFGEGRPTLVSLPLGREAAGAWFTLDGRRLDGKPSRAGVYINKGVKVVIK